MINATEPSRILVDLRTTARLLSLSDRKVWQLARDGELKSVRIGRSRGFDMRDVHELIDRLKVAH